MEPLTIKLSESTQRKLGAIAVLTGKSYSQILETASELVDGLIGDELVRCVTTTTGRSAAALGVVAQTEPTSPHQQTFISRAQEQVESGFGEQDSAEKEEDTLFGQFDHSLSSENDDGEDNSPVVEVPGVEIPAPAAAPKRRVAAKPQPSRAGPSNLDDALKVQHDDIVDVGEDAEAFLDGIIEEAQPQASQGYSAGYAGVGPQHSQRPVGITKKFQPNKPRVRISEHTGDEE